MPPSSTPWTLKITDKLSELWGHDWSCAEIAERLNVEFGTCFSRNAIIGRAARIGLKRRKILFVRRIPKPKKSKDGILRIKPWRGDSKMQLEIQFAPVNDFVPLNIPFFELQPHHCREVMPQKGDDGLALYCGHLKLETCSYCAFHARINYTTAQQLREDERERRRQQALKNIPRSFGQVA